MAFAPPPAVTPGVSAQTLAEAFRQASALLKAGMTLDQALSTSVRAGPPHFQRVLEALGRAVGRGTPLSQALRAYPGVFHPVVPAIVSAGEQTGNLDDSFTLLAQWFEAEAELRRTVQGALIYPAIVVVTAILAVGVLSFINFMSGAWAVRLLWLLAAVAGIWLLLRFRLVQRAARYLAMLLPFFGSLMQQLAVARFCHTFGLLARAGVPYLEGLQTTQPAVQHPRVERAVGFVYAGVRNGVTIEESIRAQPVFPPVVHNLVGAGEQAGSIDSALLKAGEYLRRDAEYRIKAASKFAGPVATVVLGIIVLLILIAFWSSYFQNVMGVLE